MQQSPAVSVMMCVYNSQRYLPHAIEGILAQTFSDFELVAADDGSTDRSLDLLQNYARRDSRINLLAGAHAGLVATRNRALAASRGEFIAIADSDDISLPARLETQVRFLRQHPQFVAVGCSRKLIDSDGAPICDLHAETDPARFRQYLTSGIHAEGCVLMMKREAVAKAGGFARGTDGVEDLDILLRLLELGAVGNVPEVLVKYRKHPDSVCYSNPHLLEHLNEVLVRRGHARLRIDTSVLHSLPKDEEAGCRTFLNHLRWSYWSLKGGNFSTALKHAVMSARAPVSAKSIVHLVRAVLARAPSNMRKRPAVHKEQAAGRR